MTNTVLPTASPAAALFVSVDPVLTADITARIEVQKAELARLKTAKEGAASASDKRRLKEQMNHTEQAIGDLRNALPPTYLNPPAALEMLMAELAIFAQRYEAQKAEFITRLQNNPVDALSWRSDDMVKAQAKYEQVERLLAAIARDPEAGLAGFAAKVEQCRAYALEECLRQVRGGSGSTSVFDNAISACRAEASKELYERDLLMVSHKAQRFAAMEVEQADLRAAVATTGTTSMLTVRDWAAAESEGAAE